MRKTKSPLFFQQRANQRGTTSTSPTFLKSRPLQRPKRAGAPISRAVTGAPVVSYTAKILPSAQSSRSVFDALPCPTRTVRRLSFRGETIYLSPITAIPHHYSTVFSICKDFFAHFDRILQKYNRYEVSSSTFEIFAEIWENEGCKPIQNKATISRSAAETGRYVRIAAEQKQKRSYACFVCFWLAAPERISPFL